MGPQRKLGIYVDFDSPSIIRYLEPLIGDVFRAKFSYCHFNEVVFPPLGGEKSIPKNDEKLLGMHPHYLILILIQTNVNWKFK